MSNNFYKAACEFIPRFEVCENTCGVLEINDNVGWQTPANPTGWSTYYLDNNFVHLVNLKNLVNVATIKYRTSVDGLFIESNVIQNVHTSAAFDNNIFNLTSVPIEDGYVEVVYNLEIVNNQDPTQRVSYEKTIKYYSICGVTCCINKLWLSVIDEKECGCSKCKDESTQLVMQGQSMLTAIRILECSKEPADIKLKNDLLKKLKSICKKVDCKCK